MLSLDAILGLGAALGVGLIAYAWIRRVQAEARTRGLTLVLEESRRTGEELRLGEARLRRMVEGLSVGVTLHGADGGVVYANAAAQDDSAYLEANRGTCPGTGSDVSFYQDVQAYTRQGDKYYFRVRASGGTTGSSPWSDITRKRAA